jgi:hypothetical protein
VTRTFVIVPVRDQWHLTERVLACLAGEAADDVLIIDNGSVDDTPRLLRAEKRTPAWGGRLHSIAMPHLSIYEMWNYGFKRAKHRASSQRRNGACNVALLNNDVELYPDTIGTLAHHLRIDEHRQDQDADVWVTYPDYSAPWPPPPLTRYHTHETRGVLGDGGMFGPCFMLRGEAIYWTPLVTDPDYRWWYGDNHLAECIELAGGRQMRVVGLPIKHVNEGTAQHHDLYAAKLQDRGRFVTRHQRGYGVAP